MKYLLIILSVFSTIYNSFSQQKYTIIQNDVKSDTTITYNLQGGTSIEIPQRVLDSLLTEKKKKELEDKKSTFYKPANPKQDNLFSRAIDISEIYKLYYAKRDKVFSSMKNQPIPQFQARDTEGYDQSPSKYLGRVLVLHFWGFWSSSFEREIPELNHLVDKYQKDGLAILSFTSVPIGDSEKEKLKENPLNFPLIDNAYQFTDAFFKMQLERPCLVIVDKMGQMQYLYDASLIYRNENHASVKYLGDIEKKIEQLLK
jgi:peroxiredoxin